MECMRISHFCFVFVDRHFVVDWLLKMRRTVGTIPRTLDMQLEEGNFYEALQLYKSLQSRWILMGTA